MEAGAPSEYELAARQIRDARESDVVERALSAARERLGMDAAYIATVDSRKQTIEVMVGKTNAEALVEGAVIPVDQTYCARMLKGEIPNIVSDVSAEPELRNVTVIRSIGAYIARERLDTRAPPAAARAGPPVPARTKTTRCWCSRAAVVPGMPCPPPGRPPGSRS